MEDFGVRELKMDLVLIPGAGSTPEVWDRFSSFLPKNIGVHRFTHLEISDVLEVAQAAAPYLPDKFAVIGHSFGAHIALALCELFPERIENLVVVAGATAAETINDRMDTMLQRLSTEGYESVVNGYYDFYVNAGQSRSQAEVMRQGMVNFGNARFKANIEAMRWRPDWSKALGKFNAPSLFVGAQNDTTTPPASVKQLAHLVRGSTYIEIPNCTHAIPVEQPRALAAVTLEWWRSIG